MNALTMLARRQGRAEAALARRLHRVGQRHRADHDVYYLCSDLARWSQRHATRLAALNRARDSRLHRVPAALPAATARLRTTLSRMLRHREEPSLVLLAELTAIYRQAAAVSLRWDLLAQGAQAVRDAELLAVAAQCHPETLQQMRWIDTVAKELSPQALAG